MAEKTAKAYQWMGSRVQIPPLFRVFDNTATKNQAAALNHFADEKAWADLNGIRVESPASYLPALNSQKKNLATWFKEGCTPSFLTGLTSTQKTFFAPFWESLSCARLKPHDLSHDVPPYVKHLNSGEQWLTLFFPKNEAQKDLLQAHFSDMFSLRDLADTFPRLLLTELLWMIPLAFTSILGILLSSYLSLPKMAFAMLPFICGIGTASFFMRLAGEPATFVSVVAFLMLAGISVDYGIFMVAAISERNTNDFEVESALTLSSLTTFVGVLPLAFCGHPVLRSLGIPLAVGILGTLLGALVVLPTFFKIRPPPIGGS
jgi:hypothetical protein